MRFLYELVGSSLQYSGIPLVAGLMLSACAGESKRAASPVDRSEAVQTASKSPSLEDEGEPESPKPKKVATHEAAALDTIPRLPLTEAQLENVRRYYLTRSAELLDAGRGQSGPRLLVSVRDERGTALHVVDSPLGQRRQLTFAPTRLQSAALAPQDLGRALAVVQTREVNQLIEIELASGFQHVLFESAQTFSQPSWSPAGERYILRSVDVELEQTRLMLGAGRGRPGRTIQLAGAWELLGWRDEEHILIQRTDSEATPLVQLDILSESMEELAIEVGLLSDLQRSGAGRWVAVEAHRPGRSRLVELNLIDRQTRVLFDSPERDVSKPALESEQGRLAFVIEAEGRSGLALGRLSSKQGLKDLVELPSVSGRIRRPHFVSKDRLTFTWEDQARPSEVYEYDARRGVLQRWTESETAGLDLARLSSGKQVQIPTESGGTLHATYYLPTAAPPTAAAIWLEGKLGQPHGPRFRPLLQILANELGVAILAPSLRGAHGFGAAYEQADNLNRRLDVLLDVEASLHWLSTRGGVPAGRIGVLGQGYGGWVALHALNEWGDSIKVGVVAEPTVDLRALFSCHDERCTKHWTQELGDPKDAVGQQWFERLMPVHYTRLSSTPTLVDSVWNAAEEEDAPDVSSTLWNVSDLRCAWTTPDTQGCEVETRVEHASTLLGFFNHELPPIERPKALEPLTSEGQ